MFLNLLPHKSRKEVLKLGNVFLTSILYILYLGNMQHFFVLVGIFVTIKIEIAFNQNNKSHKYTYFTLKLSSIKFNFIILRIV